MDTPPVHTEGTPSKCGLCNMSDCFDVETQVCFRCTTVPKARPIAKPVQPPSPEDQANVFKRLNSQFDDSVKQEKAFAQEARISVTFALFIFLLNLIGLVGFSLLFAILIRSSQGVDWVRYWMVVLLIVEISIGVLIRDRHPFLAKGFIYGAISTFMVPVVILVVSLVYYFFGKLGLLSIFWIVLISLYLRFIRRNT